LTKILPKCSSLNFRVNASNLGKFSLFRRVHRDGQNKQILSGIEKNRGKKLFGFHGSGKLKKHKNQIEGEIWSPMISFI